VGLSVVICDEWVEVSPGGDGEIGATAADAAADPPATIAAEIAIKNDAVTKKIRLKFPLNMLLLSNQVGYSPWSRVLGVWPCVDKTGTRAVTVETVEAQVGSTAWRVTRPTHMVR
jgi:hypothetical protein